MYLEITRAYAPGKGLTASQRTSSLFSEEPMVMGHALRRGMPPLKINEEQFKRNVVQLRKLFLAGSINIKAVDGDKVVDFRDEGAEDEIEKFMPNFDDELKAMTSGLKKNESKKVELVANPATPAMAMRTENERRETTVNPAPLPIPPSGGPAEVPVADTMNRGVHPKTTEEMEKDRKEKADGPTYGKAEDHTQMDDPNKHAEKQKAEPEGTPPEEQPQRPGEVYPPAEVFLEGQLNTQLNRTDSSETDSDGNTENQSENTENQTSENQTSEGSHNKKKRHKKG